MSCISCGLFKDVVSPKMPPHGEFRRKIMTIGEAPGAVEDKRGKPWQGPTGRLLRDALYDVDVNLDLDCISLNSVACRPPENREPAPHERACCQAKFVEPSIRDYRPRVIILLGGVATASVLGQISPLTDSISKWRGWRIPVPDWGCHVCPTYHPSFVAREERNPEVGVIWRRDLAEAVKLLDAPLPRPDDLRRRVRILRGDDAIVATLAAARRARFFSFDYETTGLVPEVQELISASFATSGEEAFAFPWTGSEAVRRAWIDVLEDGAVGKIAHNIKFEAAWSAVHLGVEGIAWAFDTMLAAHVLDNRQGVCGLDVQAFLNFGVPDWSTEINPYMRSTDGYHAPNRLREFVERFGEDALLVYNGIDSLVGYRLAMRQMEQLGI